VICLDMPCVFPMCPRRTDYDCDMPFRDTSHRDQVMRSRVRFVLRFPQHASWPFASGGSWIVKQSRVLFQHNGDATRTRRTRSVLSVVIVRPAQQLNNNDNDDAECPPCHRKVTDDGDMSGEVLNWVRDYFLSGALG
jgi:hypothetical protein